VFSHKISLMIRFEADEGSPDNVGLQRSLGVGTVFTPPACNDWPGQSLRMCLSFCSSRTVERHWPVCACAMAGLDLSFGVVLSHSQSPRSLRGSQMSTTPCTSFSRSISNVTLLSIPFFYSILPYISASVDSMLLCPRIQLPICYHSRTIYLRFLCFYSTLDVRPTLASYMSDEVANELVSDNVIITGQANWFKNWIRKCSVIWDQRQAHRQCQQCCVLKRRLI